MRLSARDCYEEALELTTSYTERCLGSTASYGAAAPSFFSEATTIRARSINSVKSVPGTDLFGYLRGRLPPTYPAAVADDKTPLSTALSSTGTETEDVRRSKLGSNDVDSSSHSCHVASDDTAHLNNPRPLARSS